MGPLENHNDEREAPAAHGGSSVRTYLIVGAVLAIITVVEVQLPTWLAAGTPALVTALLLAALIKAGLVMVFYMHLKSDSRAYSGIVALSLLLVTFFLVLLTFGQYRI